MALLHYPPPKKWKISEKPLLHPLTIDLEHIHNHHTLDKYRNSSLSAVCAVWKGWDGVVCQCLKCSFWICKKTPKMFIFYSDFMHMVVYYDRILHFKGVAICWIVTPESYLFYILPLQSPMWQTHYFLPKIEQLRISHYVTHSEFCNISIMVTVRRKLDHREVLNLILYNQAYLMIFRNNIIDASLVLDISCLIDFSLCVKIFHC